MALKYEDVMTESWYADTGASWHMTNDATNLYDFHERPGEIIIGNGVSR